MAKKKTKKRLVEKRSARVKPVRGFSKPRTGAHGFSKPRTGAALERTAYHDALEAPSVAEKGRAAPAEMIMLHQGTRPTRVPLGKTRTDEQKIGGKTVTVVYGDVWTAVRKLGVSKMTVTNRIKLPTGHPHKLSAVRFGSAKLWIPMSELEAKPEPV